jgi:two-component system, NtrC family, nitrogen regulation sensor histidine kinase GlnL
VIYAAFDHLATLVAVVQPHGQCVFANAAFESVLGLPRASVQRSSLFDWVVDGHIPNHPLREALGAVASNTYATGRLEAALRRPGIQTNTHAENLPVHIIVTQMEGSALVLVELIEIEHHTRQDREERALDQAQATKELIRNLAHEIKNPLGGIRGAAQLLEMELTSRALHEYTQVIIQEADRLQTLVDRLLAPHRKPHVVGDVNIHEVCERVRALVLAEFPRGLQVVRDYDTSIPEFRGDREQLIQAVLNMTQNAAQALSERMQTNDACITLRTRIARQVTVGKHRWRLALELLIEDNGAGIPEGLRDRIFYPLVSGRDGGSGLGLTLAQTFIQQHAGLIECDSEPGRTVFTVVIPLP